MRIPESLRAIGTDGFKISSLEKIEENWKIKQRK
jgi:hypothetical protein